MKIGTDIVLINRFKDFKNIDYIFNKEELDYFNKTGKRTETLAGIFAAKEAFLKAAGLTITSLPLKDIIILHEENGRPYIKLKKEIDNQHVDISISHDGNYAISTCIIHNII